MDLGHVRPYPSSHTVSAGDMNQLSSNLERMQVKERGQTESSHRTKAQCNNSDHYKLNCRPKVLQSTVRPSVQQLKLGPTWITEQDTDPKCSSKFTPEWLTKKRLNVLKWSSQNLNRWGPVVSGSLKQLNWKNVCKPQWTEHCNSADRKKRAIMLSVKTSVFSRYQIIQWAVVFG